MAAILYTTVCFKCSSAHARRVIFVRSLGRPLLQYQKRVGPSDRSRARHVGECHVKEVGVDNTHSHTYMVKVRVQS